MNVPWHPVNGCLICDLLGKVLLQSETEKHQRWKMMEKLDHQTCSWRITVGLPYLSVSSLHLSAFYRVFSLYSLTWNKAQNKIAQERKAVDSNSSVSCTVSKDLEGKQLVG